MELINPEQNNMQNKIHLAWMMCWMKLKSYTLTNHPHAHMLSGHVQGKVLELFSKMIAPERILEIGTFTGFSALCLAKGLTG